MQNIRKDLKFLKELRDHVEKCKYDVVSFEMAQTMISDWILELENELSNSKKKNVITRVADMLNDSFSDDLAEVFKEKFGIEIETMASLFGPGKITVRKDGEDFTDEQKIYIEAYEAAYLKTMLLVRELA